MNKFIFIPKDVCSVKMEFLIEGEIIKNIKISKGCAGNSQGVARLSKEQPIRVIEEALCGIKCPGSATKQTSCPDQLSKGLTMYKTIMNNEELKQKFIDEGLLILNYEPIKVKVKTK
ncbi:MAG: TIGR03905 family TSCPD domain-containing protein [Bacilli bacterium]